MSDIADKCLAKHTIFGGVILGLCLIVAGWLYAMSSDHDSRLRILEQDNSAKTAVLADIKDTCKRIEGALNKHMDGRP